MCCFFMAKGVTERVEKKELRAKKGNIKKKRKAKIETIEKMRKRNGDNNKLK